MVEKAVQFITEIVLALRTASYTLQGCLSIAMMNCTNGTDHIVARVLSVLSAGDVRALKTS